jgi:glycosyltransferase involved in cell wall biosynthesis
MTVNTHKIQHPTSTTSEKADKKVWVVIPAYNESSVIGDVIINIKENFPNIVVIDDFSTDLTKDISLRSGAHVVRHPINLGQGAALQTGIDYALQNNADFIITFDADGQHRVEDALSLVKKINKEKLDIVCGSRFLGVNSITLPLKRKILLRLAAIFTRISTGTPVTDAHNGLRILNQRAASKIKITQNRMAHASEIISQIKEHNLKYGEIPVTILYTPYSISKGQKMSNSINILIELFLGRIGK